MFCAEKDFWEGALMEHDMLFTSTARDGKLTTVGYIIVAKKSMAKNCVSRSENLANYRKILI